MSSLDEYSDSDDEIEAGVQTTVQLGLPDGPMDNDTYLNNPTYSRFGGQPVLLTAHAPPSDMSTCKNCSQHMELCAQLWCPLENSPLDRVLYVWACARGTCQRKAGCVRAWRAVRYNAKYAEKLERKLKQREAKAAEAAAAKKAQPPSSNPFSMNASDKSGQGLGDKIFGGGFGDDDDDAEDGEDSADDESDEDSASEDEDAAAAALSELKLDDGAPRTWLSPTPYPPLYVKSVAEYLPAPESEPNWEDTPNDDSTGKEDKDLKWAVELYERSMRLDSLFERFVKRASLEPQQGVRYDFGGTPLPYQADGVYDELFPGTPAPGTAVAVTRAEFATGAAAQAKRSYNPSRLPACPHCSAPRTFECQLMPNIISFLQSQAKSAAQTEEERKAELDRVLAKKGVTDARSGMEWGTCMVFSCRADCSSGKEPIAVWREEHVLVQWDE